MSPRERVKLVADYRQYLPALMRYLNAAYRLAKVAVSVMFSGHTKVDLGAPAPLGFISQIMRPRIGWVSIIS